MDPLVEPFLHWRDVEDNEVLFPDCLLPVAQQDLMALLPLQTTPGFLPGRIRLVSIARIDSLTLVDFLVEELSERDSLRTPCENAVVSSTIARTDRGC